MPGPPKAGPSIEQALATPAQSASGPSNEANFATFSTEISGPINEQIMIALPAFFAGPLDEQELVAGQPATAGPIIADFMIQDASADPAIIENGSAVQRDTSQTYLVDVGFEVRHPSSADLEPLVEFSQGDPGGPYSPATAQPFDRRHNVTDPITGVPFMLPNKVLNYVWNAFQDLPEGIFEDVYVRVTVTNNPSASIIIGPVTVSTTTDNALTPLERQLARQRAISQTPIDFLGNGLLIPFRRGPRDFVSGKGVELIRSAVRQILNTRAASGELAGELPWRPDFGNQIWILRHRNNDSTLREAAAAYVADALSWEPRVDVTEVFVETDPFSNPNELVIRVRYRLIGENIDANDVLIPNFEESIRLRSS